MGTLKTFLVIALMSGCTFADEDTLGTAQLLSHNIRKRTIGHGLISFGVETITNEVKALIKELVPHSCDLEDLECWSDSLQHFFGKSSKGIPEHDLRPLDPLIMTSLDYVVDEEIGLVFHFKNIYITGLKHQVVSKFKMDVNTLMALLKMKIDNLSITSDITIEFTKESKSFSGTFSAVANTLVTSKYPFDFTKDDKGVEYLDIGPETITCETVGEPDVTLDSGLAQTLVNDPGTKVEMSKYDTNRVDYDQKIISKIVEAAYVDVIYNLRASAKFLPKSAIFTNL